MMVSTIKYFYNFSVSQPNEGYVSKKRACKGTLLILFFFGWQSLPGLQKNVGVRKTAFFKMPEKRPKILKLENALTTEFFVLQ